MLQVKETETETLQREVNTLKAALDAMQQEMHLTCCY